MRGRKRIGWIGRGACAAVALVAGGAVAAPGARAQALGSAVEVAGDAVFLSEPDNEAEPGYVYAFRRDGDGWRPAGRLAGPDAAPGDRFGAALAADASILAASVPGPDGRGAVHVFRRSGEEWSHAATLTASDGAPGDAFGATLALDGDVLLVGAFARGDTAGTVYAFRQDPSGGWTQTGILTGSDSAPGDRFGVSLALDGGRALVAASRHEGEKGGIYVFERGPDGTWAEVAKLLPRSAEPGDRLGSALVLSGDRAFVGSDRVAGATGAVFTFRRDDASGAWREGPRLQPFDASPGLRFGSDLAFDGRELWVGAAGAARFAGRAYRFIASEDGEGWEAAAKVAPERSRSGDLFAAALDLRGDVAVVAAVRADFGLGAAHAFARGADGSWSETGRLVVEHEGMEAVVGGQVDCTDEGAAGFDCGEMDLLAFVPVKDLGGGRGVRLNDIWGWTDPDTGREYALVGRTDATAFVDVTDPINPVFVGHLPLTDGATPSVWRDIKVYRDHAYIVADGAGPHGMQVFDLRRLRDVEAAAMPAAFEADVHYDRIASAHNIVINEESGFAYAVGASMGGETCGGALHMIDIRKPRAPRFAGCFAETATGRQKTGYTHDAQCVVYRGPDADWQGREICFNASETAVGIADVTDKENPVSISWASYPNVAYTHQGWLTEDHRYFYVNDEGDEISGLVDRTRTLVWDVSDLDDPILVTEHLGTQRSVDHNLYVKGDRMYQSNYNSGLRVLSIEDPENPVEIGWFDTHPQGENDPSMGGSWSNYPWFPSGTIVVTDVENGLFVVRPREGRPVS